MYVVYENSRNEQGEPRERTPLGPQHSSASYDTLPPPHVPPLQPRPADPEYPGGAYKVYYYRSDLLPPLKLSGVFVLILLLQFVVWIFFYENMKNGRIALQDERRILEGVKLALKEEREKWEKARDETNIPQGAFWEVVWPRWECRSYGRREYWGLLKNIPDSRDHMDACMNMPVKIEGITIRRPDRCDYDGDSMRGFWIVDWNQVDCKPWLQDVHDKVSSGKP